MGVANGEELAPELAEAEEDSGLSSLRGPGARVNALSLLRRHWRVEEGDGGERGEDIRGRGDVVDAGGGGEDEDREKEEGDGETGGGGGR